MRASQARAITEKSRKPHFDQIVTRIDAQIEGAANCAEDFIQVDFGDITPYPRLIRFIKEHYERLGYTISQGRYIQEFFIDWSNAATKV